MIDYFKSITFHQKWNNFKLKNDDDKCCVKDMWNMTKIKVFMGGGNGYDSNLMPLRTSRYSTEKIMGIRMKSSKSHKRISFLSFNITPVITLLLILTGKGITFLH